MIAQRKRMKGPSVFDGLEEGGIKADS